jgi:hypothetical protein
MLTITSVDPGTSVVALSDGSRWTVSHDSRFTIKTWQPEHRVAVQGTGLYRWLENQDRGTTAEARLEPSSAS